LFSSFKNSAIKAKQSDKLQNALFVEQFVIPGNNIAILREKREGIVYCQNAIHRRIPYPALAFWIIWALHFRHNI
jgi:hypothetical protein